MKTLAFNLNKSDSSEGEVFSNAVLNMYNQAVKAYRTLGRKQIKQVVQWQKILRKIEDQEAFLNAVLLYHEAMMKELRGELPPTAPDLEDEGPKEYDNLTLSQRRGRYLAEYSEKHGLKSLKTSEARLILQTVEKVRLKPTVVIRALHEAAKFLSSKMDHFGGRRENRLKIKIIKTSEFFNREDLTGSLRSNYYPG